MSARRRMLMRDFWQMRGQLIAVALVVACGVASFVAMRSTYEALVLAQREYYRTYRFADVFAQVKRAPLSLAGRIAAVPGVGEVRARVVVEVTLDVPGLDEPATGRIVGVPRSRTPILNDLFLKAGRYVDPSRDDEVIASEAFATANRLAAGDTLAAVINGNWQRLTIVGIAVSPEYIYETGGQSLFPDNRRFGVLWMREDALASVFNLEGAFNDVAVTLTAGASEQDVIERLDLLLERYGGRGAYGREEQLSHRFISDEIGQNRVMSTFLPGIFLAVSAFLLHIVLSRLTTIQRTQIGLLKAFGYSDGVVALHYLELAMGTVLLGVLIGTVAGAVLGAQITALYRDFYRFPHLAHHLDAQVVVAGALISAAAAAIGALSAVRSALALPPAEAMRPESPPSYRMGLLERIGVNRALPLPGRMIARSIARRGLRSLLATLGIACAFAVLIVGGFSYDAITYLMHLQFEVVQREDATLAFNEVASASARYELTRLPGVLHSEPFRAVPARLRFEHHRKRVQITGLPTDGFLRRIVDADLRSTALPDRGALLTRKLAQMLNVSVGDVITAEVLEGARPVLRLPVAGLVDEPVGIGVYMSLPELASKLRSEGALSGAYLAVDPSHASELYRKLKQIPAVGAVAFREAAIESFREILNRSVRVTTFINVLFACVIAFGVVYNGARIALSERSRELASLRVLGFTQGEVSALLLGEQSVLTLLAVPIGIALGVLVCWVLVERLDTELYRIPLVLHARIFVFAIAIVGLAAAISAALVSRRMHGMDLVAALKARE